jgi:hypothetical protein
VAMLPSVFSRSRDQAELIQRCRNLSEVARLVALNLTKVRKYRKRQNFSIQPILLHG